MPRAAAILPWLAPLLRSRLGEALTVRAIGPELTQIEAEVERLGRSFSERVGGAAARTPASGRASADRAAAG